MMLMMLHLAAISGARSSSDGDDPLRCATSASASASAPTMIDLTVPIRAGMPVWESPSGLRRNWRSLSQSQAEGDVVYQSHLNLDAHTGTHVDAPRHFLGERGATVELLPLPALVGEADVVDVAADSNVTAAALEALAIPPDATRLLFKTQNTRRRLMSRTAFASDYVGLDSSAARWLARNRPGVVMVGIDYLSIGMLDDIVEAHRQLFLAGLVVVEGLDLSSAPAGRHRVACLPMLAVGSDGAPARCVLMVGGGGGSGDGGGDGSDGGGDGSGGSDGSSSEA